MTFNGDYFTTGEVSKLLGIAEKTVRNYCDAGRIECEKNVLTHYRRIHKEKLISFMKKNSLPENLIKEVIKAKE